VTRFPYNYKISDRFFLPEVSKILKSLRFCTGTCFALNKVIQRRSLCRTSKLAKLVAAVQLNRSSNDSVLVQEGEYFMLSILLSAIFGLAIGYFALQNAAPVTIQMGEWVFPDVPLYLVAVGSLILGILISAIFFFARVVSANMTIHGRRHHPMTESRETVAALERRIHDLELENARLTATHDNHMRDAEYRSGAMSS
jgi:uncharacterized integral membrane protein